MCYMQLIKVIEIGAVPEFTDTSTVEETDGHPRTGEVIIAFEPRQVFGILTSFRKDCWT